MSNTGEFYDHTTYPVTRSTASSSGMRQELDLVEAGFNKLPPMSGNALRLVKIGSAGADMTVSTIYEDSLNRLLVGTDTSRAVGGSTRQMQIEGTSSISGLSLFRNSADTLPFLVGLGKSRGATVGSNAIVQSGDELGRISFSGADGSTANSVAAQIAAFVDGIPGVSDMPGRIAIYTTQDGSAIPLEALRVDSTQRLLVGATSATGDAKIQVTNGVRFGGTTSTDSRTLDDYLETSFTPVLTGSTSGTVNMFGRARKIGDTAFVWITLNSSIGAGTLVGNLSITGLPHAPATGLFVDIPWIRGSTDPTANIRVGSIAGGGTTLNLYSTATWGDTAISVGAAPTFPAANITQNGVASVQMNFHFSYQV